MNRYTAIMEQYMQIKNLNKMSNPYLIFVYTKALLKLLSINTFSLITIKNRILFKNFFR